MDSSPINVTFRSRSRSRRIWQARFECGGDNAKEILRVAWLHNAEIVATEPATKTTT